MGLPDYEAFITYLKGVYRLFGGIEKVGIWQWGDENRRWGTLWQKLYHGILQFGGILGDRPPIHGKFSTVKDAVDDQ